jgi:3-oxoacyl-[acyl-carrier-protein] synthase II
MLDDTAAAALQNSGLRIDNARVGLSIGIGRQPAAIDRIEPADVAWEAARDYEGQANRLAGMFSFAGPTAVYYTACAASTDAIGLALDALRRGEADAMLCGGADAQIEPVPLIEFAKLKVLATPRDNTQAHPKPFDQERSGFVIGEGAAMFVLETFEHARRRGADVLAALPGYGSSSDAYSLTRCHPEGEGAFRAMRAALCDAGLSVESIDYINAHGTATIVNDATETKALKRTFGDTIYSVPISSTKSMSGHLLAAAGAVELAYCVMALQDQFIPPTINYGKRDPDCDLDYVPNESRQSKVRRVMSNTFGFGGQNAVLIVSRM